MDTEADGDLVAGQINQRLGIFLAERAAQFDGPHAVGGQGEGLVPGLVEAADGADAGCLPTCLKDGAVALRVVVGAHQQKGVFLFHSAFNSYCEGGCTNDRRTLLISV